MTWTLMPLSSVNFAAAAFSQAVEGPSEPRIALIEAPFRSVRVSFGASVNHLLVSAAGAAVACAPAAAVGAGAAVGAAAAPPVVGAAAPPPPPPPHAASTRLMTAISVASVRRLCRMELILLNTYSLVRDRTPSLQQASTRYDHLLILQFPKNSTVLCGNDLDLRVARYMLHGLAQHATCWFTF